MKKINLLLTLLVFSCCGLNYARGQSNNRSDFNVPPPLAPGSITKGTVTGKTTTGKPAVLIQVNIPAFGLPATSAVQLPELSAISASAPLTSQPEQSVLTDMVAGLPEIPLPAAPESPAMPTRTLQDQPVTTVIEVPIPAAPDLPEPPKPVTSSGTLTQPIKSSVPVMPEVFGPFSVLMPFNEVMITWSTPGIPENAEFRLLLPAANKASKPRGQSGKKVTGGTVKSN